MTLDRKIYLINSFSEADSEQQTNDKNNEKQGESDEMKENQNEPKEKIQSKHSKKIIFTQDLRDSKASQSFAVEQISEHTNRLASRKLMFSQKTSGVIVTPTAEEIYEKGKCVAVNDYFFLKTLGKGAFGEVKLATKDLIEDDFSEDHQRFAIKVLKKLPTNQPSSGQLKFRNSQKLNSDISNEPSDPATVGLPEAIRREIEVMKLLAHKNLVRLLEIISDTQCDSFYMVLEHIEGGPIMIYNHTTNRFVHSMTGSVMGESTARRAFRNLVSGLAHMHSHHIAHRDIKPDNLLVDFNGNLKLSDFGVSSHFSSDRHKKSISLKELKKSTSRGIITKTEGTFPFYSPEMCSESARSYSAYMADTWAASVCLWIFVFGELPFYHHDVTVLFQQIREANPNPVHRVSPELQHLLSVALSKNISLRPYLNEIRYHCWVTEEPLSDYLEKGIVYQSEGQEIPRPGSSCNSGHPLVRKASSYNENSGVDLQGVYDSPFSIKLTKQLKKLADRARTICESRRNEFILNAKSEMNYLVRKRLAEIEALNNCEKLLEQDDEDEDDPFNERNDSDSETDEINYSSYFNSNKYGYNSQFIGRRKRNYSEDYDYSENIPLVNTAEIIDKYLPHHQEEEMEAERKKKEEEERKKRMTIPPPITTSQPDQNSQGNTNDSVVKNTAYRQQQAREKDERLAKITAGFLAAPANNTNNINSTSDTTQNLQAANNRRKKLNASIELEHSSIASRHLNCKVSLKESELKYYHRPRGKGVQAVWNISFDSRKNKNKLTHRRSHVRQHLVNQIRTLNDLTLLEGDFICVEYIEEHPNAVMNPGMASKIINYYRQPPEDKIQSTQPNQEDNINDDGPTTLSSSKTDTIKRIPRHLQHLQQNSTSSDTSNNIDMIDIPKLPEGITEVLENDDPFPFIGNIEPGAPPQPCLHTNLFRAPLFSQQPKQTDFLLIRNPINRKNVHFILRQLPALFTCGQQEPLMVVTKTGKKKSLNPLQNNFLMLHITRYFLNQGSLTSDPIVSYHDIYREFEFFFKRYRNDAKRCLARVADDIGDEMWKRKPLNQIVPVEEYEIKFSPEDVCLQERALCSEFQLQELGINQLMEVPKMQQGIQRMNKLEKFRKKVLDMVKDEAQLCSKTPKGFRLETLAEILEYHLKKLRHQLEVGRFIYETIQLTPWIITESFVKGYLEKGGDGRFRLRGLGDPSGIGEAFSFLRPTKSSEKRQEDIFNTDRDLRKLPAKQLDELLMPWCTPEEIKSYPRWDKVALIRTFANIAKKENKAHELHKFARDEKTTHQSSLGQFKEGCLEIWKAQAKSLSTQWRDINEDGSDDDDDDDDDDTFDDLDDLDDDLATNIENKSGPSTSTSQGGRGRKKEDEETKEFRTIQTGQFFDGIAPNPSNPSTLSTTTPNQSGTSNNNNNNSNNKINILELKQSEFLLSSEKVEWIPPKQVLKRITRKINSDGTEVIEVKFIVSEIEVKRVLSQKANPNAITNNNQPNSRNRLTNSHYSQNGEDIFEEERTESHSLKINIGKIKSKADKHVQEKQQKKAYQELEESREFDRYNRPMRTSKDRLNAKRGKVARNMRLPHVLFASTLEEIIIGIIKRKNSTPFLYPVDTTKFKDYLSIVARPICLLDIRDNITKYKYSTVDLFLEDLQLMAKNCELFNGSNHTLTKEAYQIYNETVELINVDRDILGKDKDQYIVQQNDIRTKFNQLKRPLHSTITIPNMMPRTVDDPFIQSNKTSNQPFITPKNIDTEFDELGFGFGDADFDFDIDTNEDTALLSTSNNSTTVRSSVNDNNNNNNSQTNHSNNNNDNLKSINTTITPTSFTNTPTPTSSAQIEVKQGFSMEDVFGDDSSSSGEEEVLEEGTF